MNSATNINIKELFQNLGKRGIFSYFCRFVSTRSVHYYKYFILDSHFLGCRNVQMKYPTLHNLKHFKNKHWHSYFTFLSLECRVTFDLYTKHIKDMHYYTRFIHEDFGSGRPFSFFLPFLLFVFLKNHAVSNFLRTKGFLKFCCG